MSQIFVSRSETSVKTSQIDLSFFPDNHNFVITNYKFHEDEENKKFDQHYVFCIKKDVAVEMAIAILQSTGMLSKMQIENMNFK